VSNCRGRSSGVVKDYASGGRNGYRSRRYESFANESKRLKESKTSSLCKIDWRFENGIHDYAK